MIFVDSNIPMYLVGADHPHKHEAAALLEKLIVNKERLVTNTEVFQEILHRYVALRRKDCIQPAFDTLRGLVDNVFPITEEDILEAKDLALAYEGLSARDSLHAAQLKRYKISRILSFDRGFDILPNIKRSPDS